MFYTLKLLCKAANAVDLTKSTVTQTLTTKGLRKTNLERKLRRKERLRRRSRERGQNIRAKEVSIQESINEVNDARDIVMAQLADQIFSKGHRFLGSATNITFTPEGNPSMPLVVLAGREKVGKTSLLRSLLRAKYAVSLSNRTVNRDAMNFFNIGNVLNIVDLPGYGGTSVPWSTVLQHAALLRNFTRCQPSLKMLYYCMDVNYKHGVYVQDLDLLRFLSKEVPNFTILITKAEQIGTSAQHSNVVTVNEIKEELIYNDIAHPVLVTSAYRMGGIDTLRFDMVSNCLHALPTERLTYTEAKRLSLRLFTKEELSTVRFIPSTPTLIELQTEQWNEQVRLEWENAKEECEETNLGNTNKDENENLKQTMLDCNKLCSEKQTDVSNRSNKNENNKNDDIKGNEDGNSKEFKYMQEEQRSLSITTLTESESDNKKQERTVLNSCKENVENLSNDHIVESNINMKESACNGSTSDKNNNTLLSCTTEVVETGKGTKSKVENKDYKELINKISNKEYMKYLDETSPWRNPFYWPKNVIPTKHPRANIMRCPDDPTNPYLTQPVFVAPRADMYFRRPNVGARNSSQKGKYEADKPLAMLLKPYTIPYFPEIVDVDMHPLPWTFLGSKELYYEKNGGRELAIRLTKEVTHGQINPLLDNPSPMEPELTEEVRKLESAKHRPQISFLRPPESAQLTECKKTDKLSNMIEEEEEEEE